MVCLYVCVGGLWGESLQTPGRSFCAAAVSLLTRRRLPYNAGVYLSCCESRVYSDPFWGSAGFPSRFTGPGCEPGKAVPESGSFALALLVCNALGWGT